MLNRLMKGMSCTINIQTGENTYIGSQQQASDKVADNLRTKKIVWR